LSVTSKTIKNPLQESNSHPFLRYNRFKTLQFNRVQEDRKSVGFVETIEMEIEFEVNPMNPSKNKNLGAKKSDLPKSNSNANSKQDNQNKHNNNQNRYKKNSKPKLEESSSESDDESDDDADSPEVGAQIQLDLCSDKVLGGPIFGPRPLLAHFFIITLLASCSLC